MRFIRVVVGIVGAIVVAALVGWMWPNPIDLYVHDVYFVVTPVQLAIFALLICAFVAVAWSLFRYVRSRLS
jgi:hypothetical protein